MNTLHLTTKPRKAMKTVDGELVASFNTETGLQDIQIAGKLLSFEPTPIEYVNAKGEAKTMYRGKTEVFLKGESVTRPVTINGSAIASVIIGEVYWITPRKSKDGLYTNYVQGALTVTVAPDASEFEELYAELMGEAEEPANEVAETADAPALQS